jgi:hypothetical protein
VDKVIVEREIPKDDSSKPSKKRTPES